MSPHTQLLFLFKTILLGNTVNDSIQQRRIQEHQDHLEFNKEKITNSLLISIGSSETKACLLALRRQLMPLEKVLGQAGPEGKLAHRKRESSCIASVGGGQQRSCRNGCS